MTILDGITNAITALSGSTAALVAVLCFVVALWFGADNAISAADFHVPVRQLVIGRTWHAVAMYGRYVRTLIIANSSRGKSRKQYSPGWKGMAWAECRHLGSA